MIVDTSALVAMILNEPDEPRYTSAILAASITRISAGNLIELTAVALRRDIITPERMDRMIQSLGIMVEPVTVEQALLAQRAYREYGIGSRHPARLNFGDCFAYALSKATGEPLLFKGDDFGRTDVLAA